MTVYAELYLETVQPVSANKNDPRYLNLFVELMDVLIAMKMK